jgi:flagellar hook-basal body complex protein FliE
MRAPEGSSIRVPSPTLTGTPSTEGPRPEGSSFGETLRQFIHEVDASQKNAAEVGEAFAEGRTDDIHGTMIALQEADIRFRLLANVRNKALEAYREIMRMGS